MWKKLVFWVSILSDRNFDFSLKFMEICLHFDAVSAKSNAFHYNFREYFLLSEKRSLTRWVLFNNERLGEYKAFKVRKILFFQP